MPLPLVHRPWRPGALTRLRTALPSLLCGLALAISAGPVGAETPRESTALQPKEARPAARAFSLLDSPAWLAVVTGRHSGRAKLQIDELYGASGGRYASDLVAEFKLKLEKIVEPGRMPLVTDLFRPYAIAGKGDIRVADKGQIGRAIPGSESCTALRIGGGSDFHLSNQFVFSLDFSQVLHSGTLRVANHRTWKAGLRFLY